MTDSIISLRIDKETLKKMRMNDEINWSAFLRNCLNQKLEKMKETENSFDYDRARKAMEDAEKIRKSGIFDGGKTGVEIIREWRNKRK